MKKLLFILIACTLAIGCSKNNENPTNLIVGKWGVTADSVKLYTYPGNGFIENLQTNSSPSDYVQYNSDGSGTGYTVNGTSAFTYKVSGNKIIYNNAAHVVNGTTMPATIDTSTIVSLNGNKLILYSESVNPPLGGLRYRTTYTFYYTKQ